MDLENIKTAWKQTGIGIKKQEELLLMTKINNHPSIKRVRIKFITELIALTIFIIIYYDGFDGYMKPLWVNALLIISSLAYIVNRFIGLLIIKNPINGTDIKTSLNNFQKKIKNISLITSITTFLVGLSVILFFSTTINFTNNKYLVLAALLVSLIMLVYFSNKNWNKKVSNLKKLLEEFS